MIYLLILNIKTILLVVGWCFAILQVWLHARLDFPWSYVFLYHSEGPQPTVSDMAKAKVRSTVGRHWGGCQN